MKATWTTSRGLKIGALFPAEPGAYVSQFKDVDLSGGFGLTLTAYMALANVHIPNHANVVVVWKRSRNIS
jgi:hypothetical protein